MTLVKITREHPRALNSPAQATISSQAGDRSVASKMVSKQGNPFYSYDSIFTFGLIGPLRAGAHQGRKIFLPEPQGHVHQADEHRHLHQGADDRGKGLTRLEAEDCHRHRDGQLKIVAGRGKRQGGGNAITRPGLGRHIKSDEKHHHEIDDQGNGDPDHVQGQSPRYTRL